MSNAYRTTSYTNPWHKPGRPEYGPAEYVTDAQPFEYRGYLVYQRIAGRVWDVVKDGACVTQMAGPNGARRAIDRKVTSEANAEGRAPHTRNRVSSK